MNRRFLASLFRLVRCHVAASIDGIDGIGLGQCVGGNRRDVPTAARSGGIEVVSRVGTMSCLIDVNENVILWRAVEVVAAIDVACDGGVAGIAGTVGGSNIDIDLAVDCGSDVACGVVHAVLLSQSATIDAAVQVAVKDVHRGGVRTVCIDAAEGRATIDNAVDGGRMAGITYIDLNIARGGGELSPATAKDVSLVV